MPPTLVDQLWELIQPLLPRKTRRYRHPGRRRIDDRKALNWQQLHELLLARLRQAGRLDFSRAVCDSASLRALSGAPKLGRVQLDALSQQLAAVPQRLEHGVDVLLGVVGVRRDTEVAVPLRGDDASRGQRGDQPVTSVEGMQINAPC